VLKSEQGKEIYSFFKTLSLAVAQLAFYSMGKGRFSPGVNQPWLTPENSP